MTPITAREKELAKKYFTLFDGHKYDQAPIENIKYKTESNQEALLFLEIVHGRLVHDHFKFCSIWDFLFQIIKNDKWDHIEIKPSVSLNELTEWVKTHQYRVRLVDEIITENPFKDLYFYIREAQKIESKEILQHIRKAFFYILEEQNKC